MIIQIMTYSFIALFFGFLSTHLMNQEHHKQSLWFNLLGYGILVNAVTVLFIRFGLEKPQVLMSSAYTLSFAFKFVLVSIPVGLLFMFLQAIINNTIIFIPGEYVRTRGHRIVNSILVILIVIGAAFFFFSRWFTAFFGALTPEQFIFNLISPVKGTGDSVMTELLKPIVKTALVGIVFALILLNKKDLHIFRKHRREVITAKQLRTSTLIIGIVLALVGTVYGVKRLRLDEVATSVASKSPYIESNYVKPSDDLLRFPEKKRNLIHIYVESVENSYLPKELGGHMDVNLMPEMTELAKEGISFSHNDTFGGPYQTYGSGWSVAAMVNMGMGIPLKVPAEGQDYGKSGYFLPGARGIGDILHDRGYEQTIMFGADADFGGLTTYFTSHGEFNIFDLNHARNEGLISQDYQVWWGYEDDKLYRFAKDEITRLSTTGKPFNFTMETADTHFPDGYLQEGAPTPYDSQYANVIQFSQAETVKFVRWIQAQPFYKDTTVLITGDHLSMDKKFFENFDPSYQRTVFNLILNAPQKSAETHNRAFSPVDFFPTTLSAMGVEIEGHRLGLGTDLFSKEPTLVERDGLETFNEELSRRSTFYDRSLMTTLDK